MTQNQLRLLRFFILFPEWSCIQEDNQDDARYLDQEGLLEYDELTERARLATYAGKLPA